MNFNDIERESYNRKISGLVMEKTADYLRGICPDKIFRECSLTKTSKEFWERLQAQDDILEVDYYDYKSIFDFCVKKGIKRVFDVGGANGYANFVIQEENLPLEYIVIERLPQENVFAPVISSRYPVKIEATPDDALISHLCMGYIYHPDKDKRMFNRAFLDFDHVILHTDNGDFSAVEELFPSETIAQDEIQSLRYFDTSSHKQISSYKSSREQSESQSR